MTTIDTNLDDFNGPVGDWDGVYEIIECKKALSPSGLPDIDYALNPYSGCEHGCIYCYGPNTTHSELSTWRVVRVRRNIPDRLLRELPAVDGTIGIGTVTDPYQYAEKRFRLTRFCLEVLRSKNRRIHLHTKSDLVTRDIDLLQEISGVTGVTITTLDDRVSKMTEPGAPLPSKRLHALSELAAAGVNVYALVAPVMSTLEGKERELVEAVHEAGVRTIYYNSLHLHYIDPTRILRMGITQSTPAEQELKRWGHELGVDVIDVFGNQGRKH